MFIRNTRVHTNAMNISPISILQMSKNSFGKFSCYDLEISFVKPNFKTVPPKKTFEISISFRQMKWVNHILVIVYILFAFLQMILTHFKWQNDKNWKKSQTNFGEELLQSLVLQK